MKPIKFRAWDKENKKWLHDFRIHPQGSVMAATGVLDDKEAGRDLHFWLYEKSTETMKNMELSQFTGLLDKNGKEIYEGDVVKWSDGDYVHPHNPRIAVVSFDPDIQFKTLWDDIFHYGNFAYKDTNKHLEVIGNIYENPSLIN